MSAEPNRCDDCGQPMPGPGNFCEQCLSGNGDADYEWPPAPVSPTAEAVALVKELATGGEPVVSDWDMGPDGGPRYTCGCCGAYGYPLPLTHADDCLWRRAVDLNERLGETP